jgi:hypothetical protein
MTPKQREWLGKTLTDMGKGVIIAAMIGKGTGALRWGWFLGTVGGAIIALWIAYWFEGRDEDVAAK